MNRSKKAMLNLSSQLLLQLVTAICGFIVPKLILESFGSQVNGLTTSITHFLGIIALMESGFGAVAKTAFYNSIATEENKNISGVYNATESFFRKVALVFLSYCVILAFIFPYIKETEFRYIFVMSLVMIIGMSSFVQYYFGMSYTILLNADQKGYISALLQVTSITLNALLTVWLLNKGSTIHLVKIVSSIVLFIRPIAINIYCRKKYKIDKKVPKDFESVAQKWDNFGQSVALYVHTKTSYIFITVFLSFVEVSIYSVYSLITTSLSAIITGISTGFVSGLGNIYANKEKDNFKRVFSLYEFVNHFVSFVFYTIALITMMPFVKVYTANIVDSARYIMPVFGTILVIGELVYCVRMPYYYAIINAGHFKQITNSAYIEAGINIIVSLLLVFPLGLTGLAIGSGGAMAYRTIFLIRYCTKNITKISIYESVKKIIIFSAAMLPCLTLIRVIKYYPQNFIQWILYAGVVGIVVVFLFGLIGCMFFEKDIKTLLEKLGNVVKRHDFIQIKIKSKCCGCGACADVCPKKCIHMKIDSEGFYYPVVSENTCISCGNCKKACPTLNDEFAKNKVLDDIAYAYVDNDGDIVKSSSSGGAFSAIMDSIENTYEDFAIVGAAFVGTKVKHVVKKSRKNANVLKKSKYIQSDTHGIFNEVKKLLKSGVMVLFSGTPCQVAALKCYLREEYENLLTVDIVCHGVPGQVHFDEYLQDLEIEHKSKVAEVEFRYKREFNEEKPNNRTINIRFDNEKTINMDISQSEFLYAYYTAMIFRPSCYKCEFTCQQRTGDITLGDYWGIEKIYPELNSLRGVSLIRFNTKKGENLLRYLKIKGVLLETKWSFACEENNQLKFSSIPHRNRKKFFKLRSKGIGFYNNVTLCKKPDNIIQKIFRKIRQIISWGK